MYGGSGMAKAILICGRIGCGKSTYAAQLARESRAMVLSVDEIMLSLFGQHCKEAHDRYAEGIRRYLFRQSAELVRRGVDVILDWGFWTRQSREEAKSFYRARGVAWGVPFHRNQRPGMGCAAGAAESCRGGRREPSLFCG